jgi:hypothetical protein
MAHPCTQCEGMFSPQRTTARFCSDVCRVRASRSRQVGQGSVTDPCSSSDEATLSVTEAPPALSPPPSVLSRDRHGFLHRAPGPRRVRVDP